MKSSSAIYFEINDKPSNGSCMIDPLNGTTSTLFNITCSDWIDRDEIADYLIYGKTLIVYSILAFDNSFRLAWTNNKDDAILLATIAENTTQVQLPPGNDENSSVHIFVHIRDYHECVTEYDLNEAVIVEPDFVSLSHLLDSVKTAKNQFLTSNSMTLNCDSTNKFFGSENYKIAATKLLSLSKLINQINDDLLDSAIDSKSSEDKKFIY